MNPAQKAPDLQREDGGLVADVAADDVRLDGEHPRRPPCLRRGRGRGFSGAHAFGLRSTEGPLTR